jgi:pyridoxal phosphate-dependent aminotransferase EpsN
MERIYLSPPHMGDDERALLLEAFDSNWIAPLGPHVDAFEKEFAVAVGAPHAAALSSGTGALHLALILSGVQAGDEVLTSSLTFAATANCITYVGAKPAFIDSSAATWNLDPELLAAELDDRAKKNKLPKAVIVVHLYGQCADMDPILASCAKHGVPVIEDAAEALGATYKGRAAGTFAPLAVFSFNGNKIITTSGGGMLVGTNADQIERARFLATQARDPAPHYQHSTIGFNYRLSNLLAAVGRGQLRVLPARVEARRANNAFYRQALGSLPGIAFMPDAPYGEPTSWLTCITVDPEAYGASSEEIRLHLGAEDIEARPVWKPMHLQPVFSACGMRGGKVSESLFERGLCLPSGSSLTPHQRQRVVDAFLAAKATSSASPRTRRGSQATNTKTANE